jgi:radical SAM superfamily enzyme YgiQ (UPF0313 family)
MLAEDGPSVLFVMPPGGLTAHFAEHLGTAFLRAVLARAGIGSAQYLPPRNPSLAGFARFLGERRPAIVGFSAYESNLRACRAMVRAVRETLPDAVVAVGGPNATFSPEETLDLLKADLCLRGAGEGTLVALVQAILGAERPRWRLTDLVAEIPNLVIRTGGGAHSTRAGDLSSFPAEYFRCLDDIPSPYQDGVLTTADVGLLTARGCNQPCTYCSFAAISGRKVHYHSVERVLDDIAAFKAIVDRVERRPQTISINDDAFTLAPRRAREICEGIIERGLQMPFDCETRADRVDADLLRLMKRAGFTTVSFGLESAVPRVLRAVGKVLDPATRDDPGFESERAFLESFRRAVASAKEADLTPAVSIMGGLPGETLEDFRTTLAFVESLDLPVYAHNVLSVMPGTPLYRNRARHGIEVARDEISGAWRTYHGFPVESARPLGNSTADLALWEEANEVSDAICGRPRIVACDEAAWAIVLHADAPDGSLGAWLRQVLAVSGVVVVVSAARSCGAAEHAAWLRALEAEDVPWGTFALLSPEERASGRVLRALGMLGEHRFVIDPDWPANGCAIEAEDDGSCRVPLWFASEAGAPPPSAVDGVFAQAPQIVDACRWWSGWRRCSRPRVLHVWPDATVTPCWRGPTIGKVGDAHSALAARGLALGPGDEGTDGAPGDRCPLARRGGEAPTMTFAAEALEVASQMSWHFRKWPPPGDGSQTQGGRT